MNNLLEHFQNSMKDAMKSGRPDDVSLYRMLIAAYKNRKIEVGHDLSDEEIIEVLKKQAKQRKDSIEQYTIAKRDDLVAREAHELELIEAMLPAQMSEDDVTNAVKAIMEKTGFKTPADRGKLMGAIMAELKGQADGATVNKIVTNLMK